MDDEIEITPAHLRCSIGGCPGIFRLSDGRIRVQGQLFGNEDQEASVVLPAAWGEGFAGLATAITAALEEAVAAERREIMNLLGFDENGDGLRTVEEWDGQTVNISHDSYYELEGALIDLRREGADKVCLKTIERVQKKLADVGSRARNRKD
jgi:hypothetical protein